MRKAAIIVSAVFHPIFMPLACIVVATKFDWYVRGIMSAEQVNLIYVVVALSTIAFPGVNMLLLRWYGMLNSLEMPGRKERLVPFLSTAFFFCLGYYLLRKGNLPTPIYSAYLGCILALSAIILINLRWKISVHSAGIAGVLGCTVALFKLHHFGNVMLLSALLLAMGLVLSARLYIKAHTPAQVYAGAGIGFMAVFFAVWMEWAI